MHQTNENDNDMIIKKSNLKVIYRKQNKINSILSIQK